MDPRIALPKLICWLKAGAISDVLFNMALLIRRSWTSPIGTLLPVVVANCDSRYTAWSIRHPATLVAAIAEITATKVR